MAAAGAEGEVRKRKNRRIRTWLIVVLAVIVCIGAWRWSTNSSDDKTDPRPTDRAGFQKTRQRAERGDLPAQLELAERFCSGKGVKKNIFQCAEWYRKAANLGSGIAMLRLGDLYAAGDGFILDKAAAAMWWHKAASTIDGAGGAKNRLQKLDADNHSQK